MNKVYFYNFLLQKTQVRECKIILHKLPDSLVEQCNIPLREERRKTSEVKFLLLPFFIIFIDTNTYVHHYL